VIKKLQVAGEQIWKHNVAQQYQCSELSKQDFTSKEGCLLRYFKFQQKMLAEYFSTGGAYCVESSRVAVDSCVAASWRSLPLLSFDQKTFLVLLIVKYSFPAVGIATK